MRRKAAVIVGLVGLVLGVLGSCGFEAPQFTGDAALPPVTVGFAQDASLQDEASGDIQVIVRLSRPAPEPISVKYQFVGGSALQGTDYTVGTEDTLDFAVGETEHGIPLTIQVDGIAEDDETIELALSSPMNAELGTSHHTVTISARELPRVEFMVDTSQGGETGMATLELKLSAAPLLQSSATIAVKSGGSASSFDFGMPASTQVIFPINTTTATVDIPITTDTADEDDENFIFEIATTQNIVIGTVKEHTHKIIDDDDPPVVSISANASANEGNTGMTMVTVTVSITPASGKLVTVPITYGGNATEGSDFSYAAKPGSLDFVPNQNPALSEVSKQITFQVAGDVTDEADQTVITSLVDTPTNATLVNSPRTVNTYTIMNDDQPPKVKFITANQSEFENDPPAPPATWSYMLQLSAASEKAIGFDITMTGTASIPSDYTTSPASAGTTTKFVRMSVPAGMTTAQIDLIVTADNTDEGPDETIIMTISSSNLTNVAKDTADQSRTHTIQDSDGP